MSGQPQLLNPFDDLSESEKEYVNDLRTLLQVPHNRFRLPINNDCWYKPHAIDIIAFTLVVVARVCGLESRCSSPSGGG